MDNPAPQQVSPLPNTQWEWVVVDEGGTVKGTNNQEVAKSWADCGEVVINMKTCQELDSAGNYRNIPETR